MLEVVVRRFNADVGEIVRPEVRVVFHDQNIESIPESSENFASKLKANYRAWKDIIAEAGVRLDKGAHNDQHRVQGSRFQDE